MTTAARRRTKVTKQRRTPVPHKLQATPPPPVRLTRVRAALQRIATGYYDRDDVRNRLATAVLAELRRS